MHISSLVNMQRCYDLYVSGTALMEKERVRVLELGVNDRERTCRSIFHDPMFDYVTADIMYGEHVDLLLEDPYVLPLADSSVDLVISGQMFEHCEFFWRSFREMARVLSEDGHILLTAPSSGPIHRYPVDCYRFQPDSYAALAKYAGCSLLDCWMDDSPPWHDLVGVFSKKAAASRGGSPRTPPMPMATDEVKRLHSGITEAEAYLRGLENGNPVLFSLFGLLWLEQGDWEHAITAQKMALEMDPTSQRACELLSMAYYAQGAYGPALEAIRRAMDIHDASAAMYRHLARVLMKQKDLHGAEAALWEAVAREPDDGEGYLQLYGIAEQQADPDKAMKALERAIAIDGSDPGLEYALAVIRMKAGDADGAERTLNRLIEGYPGMAPGHYQLSRIHGARGEYGKALEAVDRALALSPQPGFYLQQSRVLMRQGRPGAAVLAGMRGCVLKAGHLWKNTGLGRR